jgi:anti-sigma regulatory factor (Ser/Thr protein kinase)
VALRTIRSALRSWLRRAGVDDAAAADVVVAVWEACANAVEHPLRPSTHELVVEADALAGTVSVAVRDSGHWRPPAARSDRGLGLTLVSGLMDDVLIDRRPQGTEVRMVRAVRR